MEQHPTTTHSSSMSIASRLDHLDFIMKSLEGKQNLLKWNSSTQRQSVPVDVAVREAYFKGSLIDRVAFLERRLFQLCMEMESSSTSGASSSQTSGYASSSQASKTEPSSSFANQLHTQDLLLHSNYTPEIKETICNKKQEEKNTKLQKKKAGKNKQSEEGLTNKSGLKKISTKWPHFKILGC
ncbi:uncharacterized protein LOC126682745 [Mercurialis annua]|uniref:uncharacterized protein LOC126682745 n=1 Tax=Mercurialis annua TaxID=3986 RepID=UPI00215EC99B|nr:uncharacterized protein LOC126682745 [Mercurialis annua]